jgi:DNA-binding phage protein
MILTRDFKQTLQTRLQQDSAFREAMLIEAMNCFLTGEMKVGQAILQDYINATVGFEELAKLLGKPGQSLRRMLRPSGNPNAKSLFDMLQILQRYAGVRVEVRSQPQRSQPHW